MPIDRVRGGVIEDLFWNVKRLRATRSTVEIRNCAGRYELVVPDGTSFVEKYESTGRYEPIFERELKRRLTALADPVYYDVGSRWGYFTKFSCLVSSPRSTHGFDANPLWFSFLEQTHERDLPEVSLTNARVSAESGDDEISLDDYAAEHPPPDVVKIDIEGGEYGALSGMKETLEDERPVVFVEVHPAYLRAKGDSPAAVFDLLRDAGYDLRVTTNHRTEEHGWAPISDVDTPSDGDFLVLAE